MPYKSEKAIKLVGTDKDRRVKLYLQQKDKQELYMQENLPSGKIHE